VWIKKSKSETAFARPNTIAGNREHRKEVLNIRVK